MKFDKSLDWLKESDEDEIFGDELDDIKGDEEEMNEGLYVDPSNYDKHDDLVDVVDKAGNPQKMTRATYDKNKDSGEFEKKEPKEEPKDDKEQTSSHSSDNNPYKFTMPPFDDEIINAVQDADSLDYEDGFNTFISNSIDEDDEYFKLIYNLADGNANEKNLDSSSYDAIKKYLEALEDNNIGHNLFANRIRKALQNFGQ